VLRSFARAIGKYFGLFLLFRHENETFSFALPCLALFWTTTSAGEQVLPLWISRPTIALLLLKSRNIKR
jgi:hypothetical protein